MPECQKIKNSGLDKTSMALKALVDSFCHNQKKYGTARVKLGNAFGRVCLSVSLSVCPVCALTFKSLDLETSFLSSTHIFRISTSRV